MANLQIPLVSPLSRSLCVVCITGYQKYISPRKGFVCAHRILYQGESCSQYLKNVVKQEGIIVALQKSRSRFQACQQASNIIKARRIAIAAANHGVDENNNQPSTQRKHHNCQGLGDFCDLVVLPCECADVDCGVLDCGVLDCGGCGI